MAKAKRPKNIIDRMVTQLGGQTLAARTLEISSQTIQFWRKRGSMPTDTPEARERVLLAERLSGIHRLELVGLGLGIDRSSGSFPCSSAERRRLLKLAAGRRHDAGRAPANALAMAS